MTSRPTVGVRCSADSANLKDAPCQINQAAGNWSAILSVCVCVCVCVCVYCPSALSRYVCAKQMKPWLFPEMHSISCSYDGNNSESISTLGGVGDSCLVYNVHNFHVAGIRYSHNVITLVNVFHSPKDSAFDFFVLNTAPVAYLSVRIKARSHYPFL